jgi:hypothetical protein
MGHHLSIDKYTTPLADLLSISPSCYKKVSLDNIVSPTITQHLKIWRFTNTDKKKVESSPVPLQDLCKTGFVFSSKEAYLVLLVYRTNTKEKVDVVSFPHSLWGLVESAENLTPRGLANSISSDECTLDSFLLSKRDHKVTTENREFKYMIFAWNGKNSSALLKAKALSRGFQLDILLNKSGDSLLSFIFNGGVIREMRLQRGKVLIFDQASLEKEEAEVIDNPNTPDTERVIKQFETVYLFQWLVPESYLQNLKNQINLAQNQKSVIEQTMYPKFRKYFFPSTELDEEMSKKEDEIREYQKRFKWVDCKRSQSDDENASLDDKPMVDLRPPPQSNPIPKLAFPKDMETKQKPTQKPAIPLLNITTHQKAEPEREEMEAIKSKVPKLAGIPLDLEQVSGRYNYDEYEVPSSDRIDEESGEFSSARAPSHLNKGISLDLSKAKAIQNEILNQGSNDAKLIPSLGLTGTRDNRKMPSLAIPVSSGSRSEEDEYSQRMDYEESTGPQLKINIKNVAKLKEDTDMKEEEDLYEPPKHKRGCAQPDAPLTDSSGRILYDNSDYIMKNTSVTEDRNNKFKNICSEIIPSFLYLGSDCIAKDKNKLLENGITHIINSAGDYSPNYHDGNFKYLTFHLKDHPQENIECIFYQAINFIEEAKNENGKVYIHCVQGISRSATICIAYIILKNGLDYNEAFEYMNQRREVINPNIGFIAQLMLFRKKLYGTFKDLPVNPRVYTVCSHQREDPNRIVAKLMMEPFFVEKHSKPMDPRAVYLVESEEEFIVFIGANCKGKNREEYLKYAYWYIAELQKREKAPEKVSEVEQENVDKSFWQFWGLEEAPKDPFVRVSAWDYWFPNLDCDNPVLSIPMVQQIADYNEEIKAENKLKPRIFTYPETDNPRGVFDEEDLELYELNLI